MAGKNKQNEEIRTKVNVKSSLYISVLNQKKEKKKQKTRNKVPFKSSFKKLKIS
jgi:hypothetical protein